MSVGWGIAVYLMLCAVMAITCLALLPAGITTIAYKYALPPFVDEV